LRDNVRSPRAPFDKGAHCRWCQSGTFALGWSHVLACCWITETAIQISCHARRFTSGQRLPCIVRRMSAKVLLLSSVWWPSVARLAAGFVYASCSVEALAPAGAAIVVSRYLSRWHRYNALAPLAAMRNAIGRSHADLLV